jgi:hypothetical protein
MQQFQGHELVEATNPKTEPEAADARGSGLALAKKTPVCPIQHRP